MSQMKIIKVDNNDEVLIKITNSIARKYDCRISLDDQTGKPGSDCDDSAKNAIIEEVSNIFGRDQAP